YRRKRDTMLTALAREMPPGVTWTHPQGGLFLWVRLPDRMDTERLLPLAVEEGVDYVVGAGFHADGGGRNALRLNFSFPSEPEIEEGVRRLARIVQRNLPSAVRAKLRERGIAGTRERETAGLLVGRCSRVPSFPRSRKFLLSV